MKEAEPMLANGQHEGGENFDPREVFLMGRGVSFKERVDLFSRLLGEKFGDYQTLYMRLVTSPAGREVEVIDSATGRTRKMLMFGSNNYLGLADHPYVVERAHNAIREYGVGLSGPPLLNGYTRLHRELEERLSALKHAEETLIFSTGYSANVGLITGVTSRNDVVIYDRYSHASLQDGLKMNAARVVPCRHNDLEDLRRALEAPRPAPSGDAFVCVEGVYSMDGDLAPLDAIVPLCNQHGATLIVDDAHGTGVMGESGSGTAQHFGVDGAVDITMGTFSKALGVVGGFVSASKPIINYLRLFARSYVFSASLPPVVVAAVLAGLDVIEREPWLRRQLHDNVEYVTEGLHKLGFEIDPPAAIISLRVPASMDIREAARRFNQAGIFVNCVEYPAVPIGEQRFRISMMATHTKEDMDQLLECTAQVWSDSCQPGATVHDRRTQVSHAPG
jgi:glycine C-acetyltransferase